MSTKKSIKSLGKTFDYLRDPALRSSDAGDELLTIKDALFSGVDFHGQIWRNVRFVDCDFVGGYEIKLKGMQDCSFEGCKIVGVHDFGKMSAVRFFKCQSGGSSNWGGNAGSKDVVFEECRFIGDSGDQNHQGAIGTYGEATFLRCKIKWFDISADTGLVAKDCEFDGVSYHPKMERGAADVLIEGCRLRGTFNMVPASLQSLTLRDTVLDELNLARARVKGNIVMERVRGGYINAYVGEAKSLSMRNCQISGDGHQVFEAYAGGIKTIEIDGVTFGGGLSTEPVTIAGGFSLKSVERISNVSESIVIRNSTIPRLDASYLNTRSVVLQNNTVDSLDFSNGRVGNLLIGGNNFARTVDFTGTHAQESKVQPLANGQAKLDSSNVKVG